LTPDVCEATDAIRSTYAVDTVTAGAEAELHTIRFSSVAMIDFNVVKTEQLETDQDQDSGSQDRPRLKFEPRDVSTESRELHL